VTANLFENILLDFLQKNLFWTYQNFWKTYQIIFFPHWIKYNKVYMS